MKSILIILLLISGSCFGQCDSVKVKITKTRTLPDSKTMIWMKAEGNKYVTVCDCDKVKDIRKGKELMICKDKLKPNL